MTRKRRILEAARRLADKFGTRNLRRPFSFGVPSWRRDWYESNMDRFERLLHGQPAFKPEAKP